VAEDPSGANHRTSLTYDTDNNINKVTNTNTNDGLKTGTYDFNYLSGKGLPHTTKDPLNQQHTYSYDSSNHLKQTKMYQATITTPWTSGLSTNRGSATIS